VNEALCEAEIGETREAKRRITEALLLATGRDVKVLAAIALARVGETWQARQVRKELQQRYPSDTLLKIYWFPVIDAAIALEEGDPSRALATLDAVAPYDLALPPPNEIGTLYPVYLRGQAYLQARDGAAAATAFQRVLDHPGIVVNFVTGSLSRYDLARAYALQANSEKARAAYRDFLTLWSSADPDLPILKRAKTEYARLNLDNQGD
jgi:eukaryotic-like serine/threonine-protein kinase